MMESTLRSDVDCCSRAAAVGTALQAVGAVPGLVWGQCEPWVAAAGIMTLAPRHTGRQARQLALAA